MKLICSLYSKSLIAGFVLLTVVSNNILSQDIRLDINEKFIDYNNNYFQETLYLHTDKNLYVAGEVLWFRIYHLDALSHVQSGLSKVAYVELIDNNKPVLQTKVSLRNYEDNGSFELPINLKSGNYRLRAYTSFMKNEGRDAFFEKTITIFNTLQNPEFTDNNTSNSYTVHLFPEGGNLVKGIRSKVAIKVTDQYGRGVDCKGFILKDKTDTIVQFKTLKFGMGSLYFTPLAFQGYKAVFIFPGGELIYSDLPLIFDKGYTLELNDDDSEHISINILTNVGIGSVYLLAQKRQEITIMQSLPLVNGSAKVIIDKARLGEGITQVTLLDPNRQPVCERLYFIPPQREEKYKINTDKKIYTSREKVHLSIDTPDSTIWNKTDVSLSVFPLDTLEGINQVNIKTYLWLLSELKGNIEMPAYYFGQDSNLKAATDNLFLTQGWRRFRWEEKMGQAMRVFKFPMEYNGQIITAKVTDLKTGFSVPELQVFLSIPSTREQLYSAQSNDSGLVNFDVKNYYGEGEIILQANDQMSYLYKIEVLSPFTDIDTISHYSYLRSPENFYQVLENYSTSMQVQQVYKRDSSELFVPPLERDTLPFYGKPLNSYMLDNYTRFTTMEEVLREYVTEINVGTRGGTLHFKMLNQIQKRLYEKEALVLIDGIPLSDPNKIFQVDPLTIKQLDVIPLSYVLGPSMFTGVANFITYNGNGQGIEFDTKGLKIDYEGLQIQREFYSPKYETPYQKNSRIPDFRNTLLWMPYITKNDSEISFFTSDMKGKYIISLQGVQPDGKAVNMNTVFEVK